MYILSQGLLNLSPIIYQKEDPYGENYRLLILEFDKINQPYFCDSTTICESK